MNHNQTKMKRKNLRPSFELIMNIYLSMYMALSRVFRSVSFREISFDWREETVMNCDKHSVDIARYLGVANDEIVLPFND